MAIITLISDFGYTDHYVASIKAALLNRLSDATLVDLSHGIEAFNIAQGAFVLNGVFRDFPKGTVHLVAVDTHGSKQNRYLAAEIEGHYFICSDNGLLSLLSEQEPAQLVELPAPEAWATSFPARQIFVRAAADLVKGSKLADIGNPTTDMRRLINRQLKLTDHAITGHVVHIDHYGNLVTNITRDALEAIGHGRNFFIKFGRESIDRIYTRYNDLDSGDCICLFNDQNLLEIAIVKGNGAELLGLQYDSQVDVQFYPVS